MDININQLIKWVRRFLFGLTLIAMLKYFFAILIMVSIDSGFMIDVLMLIVFASAMLFVMIRAVIDIKKRKKLFPFLSCIALAIDSIGYIYSFIHYTKENQYADGYIMRTCIPFIVADFLLFCLLLLYLYKLNEYK